MEEGILSMLHSLRISKELVFEFSHYPLLFKSKIKIFISTLKNSRFKHLIDLKILHAKKNLDT